MYPYQKIATDLRKLLETGEVGEGEALPPENELAERYGVVRLTVRRALGVLQGEDLVEPRHARGWYRRRREHMIYRPQQEIRTDDVSQRVEAWAGQIAAEGRVPSQEIAVSIVPAPPAVAERLELEPGDRVVVRQRVRLINGARTNINDSYYPYDLVKDSRVLDPGDVPEGITEVLTNLGYPQTRWIDEIDVAMPTPEQQTRLGLGPGTPVAIHTVTAYTADDQPVRCSVNVLPGDRHRIVYDRGGN